MQIKNRQYSAIQPSFKQVNLIQVSKKLFPNPDNLTKCHNVFQDLLKTLANDKLGRFGHILAQLGVGTKKIKTLTIAESPGFDILEKVRANGESLPIPSYTWLENHTGVTVEKSRRPDKFSFFVLTGKDKDATIELTNLKGIFKATCTIFKNVIKSLISGGSDVDKIDGYWFYAELARVLNEDFTSKIAGKPVHKFDLEELTPEAMDKIVTQLGIK